MKEVRTEVYETHKQQKVQYKNQLEAVKGKLCFKQKSEKCNKNKRMKDIID